MLTSTHFGRAQSSQPWSDERIRKVAPSVFAAEAHESRSARYAYIPTAELLRGLRTEGFEVFDARQSRARLDERRNFTKHMLRLRHMGDAGRALAVGDSVPEIVLVNSHDGTSSYQMLAGMFRLVCTNGLMVAESTVGDIRIPHSGKVQDRVTEGAFEILDGLTRVIEERDAMQAIKLDEGEQLAFGRAALLLKYDDPAKPAPIEARDIIQSRRFEDRAPDLWTTFNRTQENLIRGGLRTRTQNGRRTRTRAVEGIDQSVSLNRALWALAEEMRNLKG